MSEFNIKDTVIEITSNRKGVIVGLGPSRRGSQIYNVMFAGASKEESVLDAYLEKDYDITDPFERCKQNVYGDYSDFARINTSFKIENSNNNTISSLKASKTKFRAYQFKPLLKFLNSDSHKILVADEVGLGKTIEAGHIMLELKARNDLRNVLIVCPKSLKNKWKEELREKFDLTFKIYDNTKDAIEDLNNRQHSFRGIVNYEQIRPVGKDPNMLDDKSFMGFINNHNITFSLVLCDEAHRMRNGNTQTYKGAENLLSRAKSAIFLTATPIMISMENLYYLLRLLEPESYDDKSGFLNDVSLNVPFLQALREIKTKMSLPEIANNLMLAEVEIIYKVGDNYEMRANYTIGEYYKSNPLFQRLIKWMNSGEDSLELRAKIQFDLTLMNEMSSIFSRTRKRDITTDWTQAERRPYPIEVSLTSDEREIFDDIIEQYIDDNSYEDYWGDSKLTLGATMGLVTKKKTGGK